MSVESADLNSEEPEEVALFKLYRASRDKAVRDDIFSLYLPLVESVCRHFSSRARCELEDLMQVGYLGLLGAVERFNLDKGVKFSTYARHCIDGEVRHFLRDKSESIRRPRWMKKLSSEIAAFIERYQQANSRLPTLAEISKAINVTEEGVVTILRARHPLSLEDEFQARQLSLDTIKSLQHLDFRLPIEDRIAISQAFERLLSVEKKIIYLFFVNDLTQKQIAGELSFSPRKVSRLMQKGLERLRHWLEVDKDKDK